MTDLINARALAGNLLSGDYKLVSITKNGDVNYCFYVKDGILFQRGMGSRKFPTAIQFLESINSSHELRIEPLYTQCTYYEAISHMVNKKHVEGFIDHWRRAEFVHLNGWSKAEIHDAKRIIFTKNDNSVERVYDENELQKMIWRVKEGSL